MVGVGARTRRPGFKLMVFAEESQKWPNQQQTNDCALNGKLNEQVAGPAELNG